MHRVIGYSAKNPSGRNPDPALLISASINGGSPKAGLRGSLSLNMAIDLSLKIAIPAFQAHTLPALSDAARQVFENADKLGLSD
jgi:hypothetical protein